MAAAKKYSVVSAIEDWKTGGGDGEDDALAALDRDEKGRIRPTLRNAYLLMSHHEAWRGVIAYDSFSERVVKRAPAPWQHGATGSWDDDDDTRAAIWMSEAMGISAMEPKVIARAVRAIALENEVHPVREYLRGLKWDGKPRLDTWLAEYLGAERNEYTAAVGRKWMIGAVARVMAPGQKMDHILILEGPQGRWKSTALKTLAGEWFLDTPIELGDKDAYVLIRGAWIVELAELESLLRVEPWRAKAFFSRCDDQYVPKYAIWPRKSLRQCVFAGTVNHRAYLRDSTGNRRYWPVSVQRAQIDLLTLDRDQLWAEALARYEAREAWWMEPHEAALFAREQELRYLTDAYEETIAAWLVGKTRVTMAEILGDALHLDRARWSLAEQTRVGKIMERLKWTRVRSGGKSRSYYYVPEEREPGEDDE